MNRLQTWKKIYIVLYKSILRLVYNLFSLLKKHDDNKIVIALYRSTKLEGNLKFIYDEIIEQQPYAKIHLVSGENKMNLRLFREVVALSNARYLILDDYYLPIYLIKPKKKLKVVQLWHAAGAFKKFGHSTIGTKFGPNNDYLKLVPIHSNYTHVYVSSEKIINYYAEAFNVNPRNIHPIGVPRIDLFSQKDLYDGVKNRIYTDYPILKENPVNILVAPTYRAKGSQKESMLDFINSIINISSLLNNKYIIFKAHPYMNKEEISRLKECTNVLIASNKYTINEWMLVSDAFITDYSSSIFEYALLNKPLAHFIPDYNEYKRNRGLYQEIEMISEGTILTDNIQLTEWINKRRHKEYLDSSKMVNYNFDNTENISKKIVNHFISC